VSCTYALRVTSVPPRRVQVCVRVADRPPAQKVQGPVDFSVPEENYVRVSCVRAVRARVCVRERVRAPPSRPRTDTPASFRPSICERGRTGTDRLIDRPIDRFFSLLVVYAVISVRKAETQRGRKPSRAAPKGS